MVTLRADVAVYFANSQLVIVELGAMAGTKLRQRSSDRPGKEGFLSAYVWRRGIEDSIRGTIRNNIADDLRMDFADDLLIGVSRDDAVAEMRLN